MMAHFTAYIQRNQGKMGVSLRGGCTDSTAARQLETAVEEAITKGLEVVWIDCQRLEAMTWQGQRAILNADRRARITGVMLQWCGMPGAVLEQLVASGLSLLLHLQAAADYQGPRELLQDELPVFIKAKSPPKHERAAASLN